MIKVSSTFWWTEKRLNQYKKNIQQTSPDDEGKKSKSVLQQKFPIDLIIKQSTYWFLWQCFDYTTQIDVFKNVRFQTDFKVVWYTLMYFLTFPVFRDIFAHWCVISRSYRLQWWSGWVCSAEQSLFIWAACQDMREF